MRFMKVDKSHKSCVRSARIFNFSGQYFPAFGLKTEIFREILWENADQKSTEYGHFSSSETFVKWPHHRHLLVDTNSC